MPKLSPYMSYEHLRNLRQNHAAWRLLTADYAPLAAAFFYKMFIAPKRRGIEAQELLNALDMFLYDTPQQMGEFARSPKDYLEMWADSSYGWLRKYEHHEDWYYDLTAPAQKAVEWLLSLHKQDFVGTESRLRTVINLLQEIAQETDTNVEHRLAYLREQAAKIAAEIAEIEAAGEVQPRLDNVQIKERFLQAEATAAAILADFREVEENFRELTRKVQADVVKWTRGKGELLEKIFLESDIIRKSEQGRSFMAFWRFLMYSQQQDALRRTLLQVEQAEPLQEIAAEHSLADINHEWVQAAAAVQKTLAQLSAQLRRYVDEDYLREERAIYRLIQQIESQAIDLQGKGPAGAFMDMNDIKPGVALPMERRLFAPPQKTRLDSPELTAGDGSAGDIAAIFDQVVIDKAKLRRYVTDMLKERPQVTLAEVLAVHPLEQGLSELLAYFVLASKTQDAFSQDKLERILFERDGRKLLTVCQQVTFGRGDFTGE